MNIGTNYIDNYQTKYFATKVNKDCDFEKFV